MLNGGWCHVISGLRGLTEGSFVRVNDVTLVAGGATVDLLIAPLHGQPDPVVTPGVLVEVFRRGILGSFRFGCSL